MSPPQQKKKFWLYQKNLWKGRENVEIEVYDKEGLFFIVLII